MKGRGKERSSSLPSPRNPIQRLMKYSAHKLHVEVYTYTCICTWLKLNNLIKITANKAIQNID